VRRVTTARSTDSASEPYRKTGGVPFDDPIAHLTGSRLAICAECGRVSGVLWHGWTAYRIDDPETDDPPQIGLYCPACSAREFQHLPRRPQD